MDRRTLVIAAGALALSALLIELRRSRAPRDPSDLVAPRAAARGPERAVPSSEPATASREAVRMPAVANAPLLLEGRLEGRLKINGLPPEGADVEFRRLDGADCGRVALNSAGEFAFEAPVRTSWHLTFKLSNSAPRRWLLPRPVARFEPDGPTRLELDWHSVPINLRVTGDPGGWNRAQVHILGPDCDTSFETGDDGKLELYVIGAGSYRFEAQHASGWRASAPLELGPDAELESVVLVLREPRVDRGQ
jgi:hypothetical protein